MKIEFTEQEVKDLLIDKANALIGAPLSAAPFNEVIFDARYSSINSATVVYIPKEEDGTKKS